MRIQLEGAPQKAQQRFKSWKAAVLSDKRLWLCLLATLVWGLVAHAYGFLNGNFSHDSLNAFYASGAEDGIKLATGRFFVKVYRFFTRGDLVLPWLIGLLAILWISLAVYFVVRLLEVDSKPVMVLVSGIMITNITVIAQTATYIHELDCNSFALLLAVLAVWLWRQWRNLPAFVLGAGLLVGSMGIYQAFFSTAATLMIFCLILDLTDGRKIKAVFLDGIRAVGMLFCGAALYFAAGRFIYKITGITPYARTDLFSSNGLGAFLAVWTELIGKTYVSACSFLANSAYSLIVQKMNLAEAGIAAVLAIWLAGRVKDQRAARTGMVCILVLLMPFAMNLTFFLASGEEVHELMSYSIWLTHAFLLVLLMRQRKRGGLCRNVGLGVGCALVALVLWQNVCLANEAYMKKDMEAKATLSTMTRVVCQMEQREDYVFGETPVAFIGVSHPYGDSLEYEKVGRLIGLDQNNAIFYDARESYYSTYKAYFDYVLNYPLVFCEDFVFYELKGSKQVQDMPAFPDKGYMQMIDGVLVVKMG